MDARSNSAAPPKPPDIKTPDKAGGSSGVDCGYNSDGKRDCTYASSWSRGLPPDVIARVAQHRRHKPAKPLPASLQKRIARYWGAQ